MLLLSLGALNACQNKDEQAEQNFAIDTNVPADADLTALPADESSTTPSNDLVNGADNTEVNEVNTSGNAY